MKQPILCVNMRVRKFTEKGAFSEGRLFVLCVLRLWTPEIWVHLKTFRTRMLTQVCTWVTQPGEDDWWSLKICQHVRTFCLCEKNPSNYRQNLVVNERSSADSSRETASLAMGYKLLRQQSVTDWKTDKGKPSNPILNELGAIKTIHPWWSQHIYQLTKNKWRGTWVKRTRETISKQGSFGKKKEEKKCNLTLAMSPICQSNDKKMTYGLVNFFFECSFYFSHITL